VRRTPRLAALARAALARAALAGAALALAAGVAGCGSQAAALPAPRVQHAAAAGGLPGLAAQAAAVERLAQRGRPVYCGGGRRRLVALTFDDGPGPRTAALLRELRRGNARATFFLVGRRIAEHPSWPARQRERGALGTHTMTHPHLLDLSPAAASAEIADGRAAAIAAAGTPVDLFRPPYGGRDGALDREIRHQGMAQILWSVNSTDSRRNPPRDFHRTVAARVTRLARPGSIILLHENRTHTIRALRSILPALSRRHLRPVTVPELLAADPPSAARLERGARGCG